MGLNIRKRIVIQETVLKKCASCELVFPEENNFCTTCGAKLVSDKTTVYANLGKKGITSISYKLASGITINSKGKLTFPVGKGISYTTQMKSK